MERHPRLIIAAVAFLVWSAGLTLGFFLDDLNNLERAMDAAWSWEGLARGFTVFDPRTIGIWCLEREPLHYFRPLFVASLKIDYAIWGLTPFGFHLTNLLLHVVNALLVHRLLLALAVSPRVAMYAGVLFAGYPHHTVALLWISGRTELLMATFVLTALVSHHRSLGDRRWWAWRLLALAAAACAFLTKEGAVVLAPLLALSEWLVRDRVRPWTRSLAPIAGRVTPYALITVGYLIYRFGVMGLGEPPPTPYFVSPTADGFGLYLAVKTSYYYVCWLLAIPIMPIAPVSFLLQHWWATLLVISIAVAGWGSVMAKVRHAPGAFVWLAWSAVALIPTATVMASNHYTYLANIGVSLLAIYFIQQMPKPKAKKSQIGFTILVCALHASLGVFNYSKMETTNDGLVQAAMAAAPDITEGEADIYLVNLPFAAVHLGQRLRMLHGADGLRANLITVSSEPFEIGPGPRPEWRGGRDLSLHLPKEWLAAPLVKMFMMMGVDFTLGQGHTAGAATLTPRGTGDTDVERLQLQWPADVDMRRQHVLEVRSGDDGDYELVRLAP
jgi:hypothetical protein